MKLFASNTSKSFTCSPVPIKTIGDSVAATALSAPPPLACPSSLVMITDPILTARLNAVAWSDTAWPIVESITNIISLGLTASPTWKEHGQLCKEIISEALTNSKQIYAATSYFDIVLKVCNVPWNLLHLLEKGIFLPVSPRCVDNDHLQMHRGAEEKDVAALEC